MGIAIAENDRQSTSGGDTVQINEKERLDLRIVIRSISDDGEALRPGGAPRTDHDGWLRRAEAPVDATAHTSRVGHFSKHHNQSLNPPPPDNRLSELTSVMSDSINPPNWYDIFPQPRSVAPLISRETVLSQLYSQDLLLIDVRRTDYEGGTIAGSLNLPAQSFYQNRETLYNLCKRAGVKKVAFYCGKPMFSD